ncbi:HAD-IA family hydrolase [Shimia sp.]|uniref:HAD-IA family hydrolase n=1 Tax=Shimia sp. TaxID=1954381 RepID=UPI003567D16A
MSDLHLVVFDVDGTLVDSQADILASMAAAFGALGLDVPLREAVLGIVGLSLDVAMARLAPDQPAGTHRQLEAAYKQAYMELRADKGSLLSSPLYPGAAEMLARLDAVPEILLGLATGKSRRGLDKLLEGHDMQRLFVTQQVADFHPSKPHPSMLKAALDETGVAAERAVMIGDTSFDMEMARAAGLPAIGVSWGYHPTGALDLADVIIDEFDALPSALQTIWGREI